MLKQLAENPEPGLIPRVAAFAKRETDADLVVHAVRFLKSAPGKGSRKALLELLKHPSWQVRAEAADALAEASSNLRFDAAGEAADIYVALIELLSDEDGFVVSRAIHGLQHVDVPEAVAPLAAAADKHPELAASVVKLLAQGQLRSHSTAALKRFAKHQDPQVRANALAMVADKSVSDDDENAELINAALADDQAEVRAAAAEAILHICVDKMEEHQQKQTQQAQTRPSDGIGWLFSVITGENKDAGVPADKQKAADADPSDASLLRFRRGKHRPKWLANTVDALEKLLADADPKVRGSAAVALIAVRGEDKALPVLQEIARQHANQRGELAAALPFMLGADRQKLFAELTELGLSNQQLGKMTSFLAEAKDPRDAALFWNMLKRPDASTEIASQVYQALRSNSLVDVDNPFGDAPNQKSGDPEMLALLEKLARDGTPWQRNIALALMINQSDKVSELAKVILTDPNTEDVFARMHSS